MIRVFTDTAANLPPEVLEKYHIRTLPLTYRVDGELPEGEFDGPAYYDAIRGGAEVKTAMVNPQDTAEGMEPVLAAGDDLLYIGISGGISGTCWSCDRRKRHEKDRHQNGGPGFLYGRRICPSVLETGAWRVA